MPKGKYPRSRRSITHDAPDRWVGWEHIIELYNVACNLDKLHNTNQYSLYFVTLFETGGRVSEVQLLRPTQVLCDGEIIKIENMEVLKRRKRFTRTVFIKIEGNPLAQKFMDFIDDCDRRYLLPGYGVPFSRTIDPESHISSYPIYKKITEIDSEIWPHWLRDQRSWHLGADVEQGGRGFDSYLLRVWFEWASMDMPAKYAGRRSEKDILEALGISV